MILPWIGTKSPDAYKLVENCLVQFMLCLFIASDLIPCITVLNISMITPPAPTIEESRDSGKHGYNLASGACMLPLHYYRITQFCCNVPTHCYFI